MTQKLLLVVDDDPMVRELIVEAGHRADYRVEEAEDLSQARSRVLEHHPDRIVLDLQLGDNDGVEVLEFLAEQRCAAPILPISGFDERVLRTAVRIGEGLGLNMLEPLPKPFRLARLQQALDTLPADQRPITRSDLEEALSKNQTTLHYQPKVDLRTGEVTAVEALARWEHPERGMVPTAEFIAVAEESGLIHPFTLQNFRRAAAMASSWARAGTPLKVAVNVSATSLVVPELPEILADICRSVSVDPALMTIEITESAAMSDAQAAMRLVTRLRLRGFELSLDDFGTGYSSLVELHRMPFSELKIDRQFVSDLDNDDDAAAISRAMVQLGHALGLDIVAEGIERGPVAGMLEDMGCDLGQGFLFSAALPGLEIARILSAGPWLLGEAPLSQ